MSGTIKVIRNEEGNCVHFVGLNAMTHWNGCLSAEIDGDNINIINNASSTNKQSVYEMKGLSWKLFRNADNELFANVKQCAQYITAACNVAGSSEPLFPPRSESL